MPAPIKKMAEIIVVISDPKSGKSTQKVLADADAKTLHGKKIGEKLNGEALNLNGYEFEITGGSDYCGFPMRKDIEGTLRKRILVAKGWGLKFGRAGTRHRRNYAGNTVFDRTAQINLKVVKAGKTPLFEDKAEEKPEAKK